MAGIAEKDADVVDQDQVPPMQLSSQGFCEQKKGREDDARGPTGQY